MPTLLTEPPDPRTRSVAPPGSGPPRGPRRPRRATVVLWRILAGVLVVAGLLWGTYNVITLLAHEERVETERFAADDVEHLAVDTANGSVTIVAADTDEISVRADISEGLRSTGERRAIVDGVLELRATCPAIGSMFCSVDYEVRLPRDVPITVHADNGRIEVTGSEAAVRLDGDNGTLELSDLSGPLDVSTDNGRVEGRGLRSERVRADSDNGRVVLEFATAPSHVEATTDNGSVEVVVPDDGEAYQVTINTDNGSENLDVRTDPASTRMLILDSDNGSVTARTAS